MQWPESLKLLVEKHQVFIEWLGVVSILTFIVSLVAIPWIIARLPKDYFIRHRQDVAERHARNPVMAKIILILRNFFGMVFLVGGIFMLLLPGQGIISMVIGISLMDFPKKHKLVDFILRLPRVRKLLNWLRRKQKKPPFAF